MRALCMARVVVLVGGGETAASQVKRLLDEDVVVVFVERPDVVATVVRAVPEGHERARFAVVAGDPSSADVRAAALEFAREHHVDAMPEVVDIGSGIDPTVK